MNRLTPFVTEVYHDSLFLSTSGLLVEVDRRRQSDPGVSLSNVGGYHSTGFVPTSGEPYLSQVVAETGRRIDGITSDLGLGKLRLNGLWINVSEPGDRNDWHYHQFTVLSAVYYVQVPDQSGDLRVERPDIQSHYWRRSAGTDPRTAQVWSYRPQGGDLLIFPAYLRHDVEANQSKRARVSIAMNYSY